MELKKEFKHVIHVDSQFIELSFRLVQVPRGSKYFVLATNAAGLNSSFEVTTDSYENWQAVPPIPAISNGLIDKIVEVIVEKAIVEK